MNTVEVAEDLELHTLALTADSETVVLDTNDNVVMPSDNNTGSVVPLTHDGRSKLSLIKVIFSLFVFLFKIYH